MFERQTDDFVTPQAHHVTAAGSRHLPRVGFLFNHEQAHQIPHSAPILAALAAADLPLELHAFVATPGHMAAIERIIPPALIERIHVTMTKPGLWAGMAEKLTGSALPLRRVGTLVRHRKLFGAMDILVAPETTSTLLKTHLGLRHTRLVYTQHGAGDRAVGFKPVIRHFDHVLIAGDKIRDRMKEAGIVREGGYSVVGYPKFDAVPGGSRPRLFANDRPTVLYNPHFHPALSSWYRDGLKVLDFFAGNPRFNLIFAPHVMLFSRALHASGKPARLKRCGRVPARYRNLPNILIDEGSTLSVDMTYTRAADIYLGDASSQVYEFIATPRPCLFLNSEGADWKRDPNYTHWHLGDVLDGPHELASRLATLHVHEPIHRLRQTRAFEATFGTAPFGGAERAASVLARLAGLDTTHSFTPFLSAAE
jgi:hypothetical protein